jgi:exonuclease III
VGCWNIEGVYEKINSVKLCKLDQPIFQETLKKHDILCLQETHLSQDEIIPETNGYVTIPHCRKISANNRYFGGFLIYIKTSIRNGVKIRHHFDEDALEVTLLKNFFGLNKDVKFLFTYASPINSCYTKTRTTNILDKIETLYIDDGGNVIIMGDLNGRTKMGDDFIRDNTDKHSPINMSFYTKDIYLLNRQNSDEHIIDEQGKLILGLCKSSALRILNGRNLGDKYGKYTRYPSNMTDKPSVIDYALCSEPLIEEVKSFSILPFTGLSDHCCISLKIKSNVTDKMLPQTGNKNVENLNVSKYRFKYDKSRKHMYEQALREDKNVEELNLLTQT